jgi:hypothetical protein
MGNAAPFDGACGIGGKYIHTWICACVDIPCHGFNLCLAHMQGF